MEQFVLHNVFPSRAHENSIDTEAKIVKFSAVLIPVVSASKLQAVSKCTDRVTRPVGADYVAFDNIVPY